MVRDISAAQLFQIFTQSIDAIDVTSVTLSRLNSINAIDILGIFWGYFDVAKHLLQIKSLKITKYLPINGKLLLT